MERFRSNSDLHRSRSNSNATSNVPKRQNLVLSTSFVSTRRFDDGGSVPTSPLLTKHRSTTINNLKTEIAQLEQQIERQKKRKVDHARLKKSSNSNDIYVDKYSTDHLENHSVRLRANSEIRDTEINIKRLQEQLRLLKLKLKRSEASSNEMINSSKLLNDNNAQSSESISETQYSDSDEEGHDDVGYRLTPTKSIPTLGFQSDEVEHSPNHLSTTMLYESPTKETATWLISDHLQSLQDINASVDFILQKANGLVVLLQKNPEIKEDLVITAFASTIQNLLLSSNQKIRSAGYRIARYLILNENTIDFMIRLHVDVFITMSLGKDNTYQEEREQALKLARRFIDFNAYGINKSITQAVVSCVELQDDSLRIVAFETLIELTFIKPELIDECRAFHIIQGFILDSNPKNVDLAVNSMLEMLSYPQIRCYFIKSFHTSYLLNGFSDYQTKLTGSIEKVQRSVKVIIRTLQNLNGLLLFALNDCQLLNQLIAFAQSPPLFKYVMHIFMSSLRIRRNTPEKRDSAQTEQYVYLLISMMNKVDFVKRIMNYFILALPKLDSVTKDDTRLVLAKTFDASMQLTASKKKFNKFKFSEKLDQYKLFHETYVFNNAVFSTRSKLATTTTQKMMLKYAGERQLNSSKKNTDDIGFKKMVFESKVLQTKNFGIWNWQVIGELCKSPLMNKKRLEELSRSTRFVRRMLVFYRPFRFRFTSVSSDDPLASTYVEVGCLFFRMLLSSNVGTRILADDTKMIPQIASVLYNNIQGHVVSDLLFTEAALKEKLCSGYFKIIFGVFTENNNGMSLLEKWNVFTVINNMFSKKSSISNKYLMLTLPELNLRFSRCKMFMNKALLDEREVIRTMATETLEEKLHNLTEDEVKLEEYLIQLTCRQLYDLAPNVVATADKILYDYCTNHVHSSKILQSSIKNCLDQLIFTGSPTLLKLMETNEGFQQLDGLNYINKERINWKDFKNREFVFKVEQFLEQEIKKPESTSKRSFPLHFYQYLCKSEEGANLLSKSDDIRDFVTVIKKYITNEQSEDSAPSSEEGLTQLTSCMWACGFIGATDHGISLLDRYSFVQDIVELANENQYTCIKNTAFYVLGLISYTMEGREMLEEIGWDSIMDTRGDPIGVCVPKDINKLLHWSDLGPIKPPPGDIQIEWGEVNDHDKDANSKRNEELSSNIIVGDREIPLDSLLEWERSEASVNPDQQEEDEQDLERMIREISQSNEPNLPEVFEDDKINNNILRIVSDMGNNILLNGAIKEISSLQSKYGPSRFQNPEMFEKVYGLLGKYRFKPSVRKFLLELFINTRAIENVIRNERRRKR
ncbi:unnamed protein product [Kluyveromyces dobzhanskii CBS 2104]|uniref:WGS project CCBQ000000000 data, contig 00011 n=1 Tax=Kluyveromyces dobzhanskii CBS 2104 TaxID=1427455 RepID=A0A0A8LA52_9SACH|nr:unnamed protein product [Kluyveromyces dobzhanskii CBS 2104]